MKDLWNDPSKSLEDIKEEIKKRMEEIRGTSNSTISFVHSETETHDDDEATMSDALKEAI